MYITGLYGKAMLNMITGKVFKAAFKSSLPVLMGYVTMGMAAGILLTSGNPDICAPVWAFLTSASSISGALQFILAGWIQSRTPLTDVLLLTLFLNIRYAMYGLSLLERFSNIPLWKKLYLIWTLTDETYALEVENKTPEGEDSITYCLLIAALDHSYWVLGVVSGAALGSFLPFSSKGIDFAMTALFLVILVDQCRAERNRIPALTGLLAAGIARCFFSVDNMLIPAMALMIAVFLIFRRKLDKTAEEGNAAS